MKTAIIREIRVVGELVVSGTDPNKNQIQHRGYGQRLLKEAERISKERGKEKVVIIAGIGVRPYFYKYGYAPDGAYVSKLLKKG